jgi:hypothetical protein
MAGAPEASPLELPGEYDPPTEGGRPGARDRTASVEVDPASLDLEPSRVAVGMDLAQTTRLQLDCLRHQMANHRPFDDGESTKVLGHPGETIESL